MPGWKPTLAAPGHQGTEDLSPTAAPLSSSPRQPIRWGFCHCRVCARAPATLRQGHLPSPCSRHGSLPGTLLPPHCAAGKTKEKAAETPRIPLHVLP